LVSIPAITTGSVILCCAGPTIATLKSQLGYVRCAATTGIVFAVLTVIASIVAGALYIGPVFHGCEVAMGGEYGYSIDYCSRRRLETAPLGHKASMPLALTVLMQKFESHHMKPFIWAGTDHEQVALSNVSAIRGEHRRGLLTDGIIDSGCSARYPCATTDSQGQSVCWPYRCVDHCSQNECEPCGNICAHPADGECDDGGPGAEYSECFLGSDCQDCGSRSFVPGLALTATLPPPPPSPSPPPPGTTGYSGYTGYTCAVIEDACSYAKTLGLIFFIYPTTICIVLIVSFSYVLRRSGTVAALSDDTNLGRGAGRSVEITHVVLAEDRKPAPNFVHGTLVVNDQNAANV